MRNLLILSAIGILAACGGEGEIKAPEISQDRIGRVHDETLTLDTHIDIPLTYMTEIDPSGDTDLQVDLPKLAKGKLDSGFWIVYTPQGDLTTKSYSEAEKIATTRINAIRALVSTHSDHFDLAKTAANVRRITSSGKHAVLIGMENAYPLGRLCAVRETAERTALGCDRALAEWEDYGVRYVGLTHFGHNQYGDSSNPNPDRDDGPRHNGLSPLGKTLVRALNDAGIMVDVSHAAKTTMMQAADLSRAPIIASHSGVRAIADSPRNLDDEQLRKIRDVNGVAQMVAFGGYVKTLTKEQLAYQAEMEKTFNVKTAADVEKLSAVDKAKLDEARVKLRAMEPPANVADFIDHIDHAVKVAGIDHVGIASDFDGGGGVVGWKNASETQNVTAELLRRGYDEGEIAKIWSGNVLRVLDATQAATK